jgi:hypothetical protein
MKRSFTNKVCEKGIIYKVTAEGNSNQSLLRAPYISWKRQISRTNMYRING